MSENLIFLIALPLLLVASAIASGSETALFRLTLRERADLRRDAPGVGHAVDALLGNPRRLLLMILIINMVVNIAYFAISSMLTTRVSGPVLGAVVGAGSVLAIVLFGEILAKVLSGTGRLKFCAVFARPLAALLAVAGPLVSGVDRFVLSPLIRVVRPGGHVPSTVSRDELVGLVESGQDAGVIAAGERRVLEEVLEMGEIRVREAMLPRVAIDWIEVDASSDEVLAAARRAHATMLLVCEGGLDGRLVGFLHVKRYLAAVYAESGGGAAPGASSKALVARCEKPLIVPEQARLDRVLERFRTAGVSRAVCVDERGSVTGMIRGTDIVDELLAGMGEATHDAKHAIHLVGLGVWRVRASLSAREWAQAFGVAEQEIMDALPRSGTIGGVVLDRLGRLAEVGDEVVVGRAHLRVAGVIGRRIDLLDVRLDEAAASDAEWGRDDAS